MLFEAGGYHRRIEVEIAFQIDYQGLVADFDVLRGEKGDVRQGQPGGLNVARGADHIAVPVFFANERNAAGGEQGLDSRGILLHPRRAYLAVGMRLGKVLYRREGLFHGSAVRQAGKEPEGAGGEMHRILSGGYDCGGLPRPLQLQAAQQARQAATYYYGIEMHNCQSFKPSTSE